MVILGGFGSLGGFFLGVVFIWILLVFLKFIFGVFGFDIVVEIVEYVIFMIVGVLIIFFLIVELYGFVCFW